METKKVNITLAYEQYELLLDALRKAEASRERLVKAIVRMGAKAPELEKDVTAFMDLRAEIEQQVETQL